MSKSHTAVSLRYFPSVSQQLHRSLREVSGGCPGNLSDAPQKPLRRFTDVPQELRRTHRSPTEDKQMCPKPLGPARERLGVFKNLPGGPWVYSRRLGDFSQKPPSSVTWFSQLPLGRTPETTRKSASGILDVPLKYPRRSSEGLLRSDRCLSEVPQKSHSGSTEVTLNTPETSVWSFLAVSQAILSGL